MAARVCGQPYPATELEEAWRRAMFNQFHDILPGSGMLAITSTLGKVCVCCAPALKLPAAANASIKVALLSKSVLIVPF
ncbi:MAG: hypothetical protein D4R79_15055 [Comamonadaceae bacterium]|nr:MAG: hypothetical protein D4R79_15055 [Comamonadaceae bacterium]